MKAISAASWCNLDFVQMAVEQAEHNPAIAEYIDYMRRNQFVPRPDNLEAPGCPDEQESFCNSKDSVAFLIGGNGAGTSTAAAYKAARFMLQEQPPPRRNTPFWVMSNTFENTCNVCWGEKLDGMGFIPRCEVESITYHNKARNQPKAVTLKPWPGKPDKNWTIEFKTFEQGRSALMGASLGGFWISETPPAALCAETVRGLRDYDFLGARMIEFTPIDPWLSLEMEQAIEKAPASWRVYRANTICNLPNLPGGQDWIDSMLAFTPPELHATRLYGDFAVFEGMIYAGFREDVHMVDEQEIEDRIANDNSIVHAMGTDWGWTQEHAHCTVWAYWDPSDGSWTVYDEYWTVSQTKILRDHIDETLDRCEQWGWPVVKTATGKAINMERGHVSYRPNHADSAAPGNVREYNLYGVPTVAYSKTENSVLEGIYHIKYLLTPHDEPGPGRDSGEPLLRVSSRCKNLLNEMRMYKWKRGQDNMMALNPGLAKPIPLNRYDHGPDALRYMIMGMRVREGWEPPRYAKQAYNAAERHAIQVHKVANRGYSARSLVRFQR